MADYAISSETILRIWSSLSCSEWPVKGMIAAIQHLKLLKLARHDTTELHNGAINLCKHKSLDKGTSTQSK